MKISFVLGGMYGLFNKTIDYAAGGSEKQLYLILKGLEEKKQHSLSCLVYDHGQPQVEKYGAINVYKTFSLEQNRIAGLFRLIKVLLRVKSDIYITRSPGITVFACFLMAKVFLRKKMWYMVAHDCETDGKELKKEIGAFPYFLMKTVYKHADVITVQTGFQQKELQKRGIKVRGIIPNIYDFKLQETTIPVEQKKAIIWVGRCETWKKPELFIEMARRYGEQHFIMVCPRVQNKTKYAFFEKIAREARKEENIEFYEYLPREKLLELYIKSRVYVLTSFHEGFSNSMMEAMESMCPILSLHVNPDNIITDQNMGFCTGGNEDEFYRSFDRLLTESGLCEKMGQNGRTYLYTNHTRGAILSHIETIINEITG